jgi:hypothetical protein
MNFFAAVFVLLYSGAVCVHAEHARGGGNMADENGLKWVPG